MLCTAIESKPAKRFVELHNHCKNKKKYERIKEVCSFITQHVGLPMP